MGKVAKLIGERFSKLVVIAKVEKTKSGTLWECQCDCGNKVNKLTTQLRRGGETGCRQCESISRSDAKVKHGGCRLGKSSLYVVWKGVRSRCRDKGNTSYPYYGGKGIKICSEWDDFDTFKSWAENNGYSKGLHLDRIDPEKDYSPSNCEFVTAQENQRRKTRYYRELSR